MSNYESLDLEERIKSFLIVGETLDDTYTYTVFDKRNILIAIIMILSTIYSLTQAVSNGFFWFFLSFAFLIGFLYYTSNSKKMIIYAITKYRIIRMERNIFSKYLFRSSNLMGFRDLHYEHVESINIGPPQVKIPFFFVSIFGIATGWLILDLIEQLSLLPSNYNFFRLVALLVISSAFVNLFFMLPLAGVSVVINSVSGSKMDFPEKSTPKAFISQLLINCRTFLSFGAE
ncbi:MAG: hypothetical protein INQ03_12960 [Candidatus Heimdallarchaeota archaeon]|nr:hypothetical protein [Candidatus Heimdallarchaeota archaeon]